MKVKAFFFIIRQQNPPCHLARAIISLPCSGRTPQVLTETLYALCVDQGVSISEVWAISTQEGMNAALDKLLDPRHGRFYQMQKDYPAPCGRVRFSAEQILVSQDGLLPVQDIRSRRESETFLELNGRLIQVEE